MNQEKLTRDLKSLFDNTSNVVISNILKKISEGDLKVDPENREKLVKLINLSFNQSFSQSSSFFIKGVMAVEGQQSDDKKLSAKKK